MVVATGNLQLRIITIVKSENKRELQYCITIIFECVVLRSLQNCKKRMEVCRASGTRIDCNSHKQQCFLSNQASYYR